MDIACFLFSCYLYILNTVSMSAMVGVASSVANDVIMRTGAASAASVRRHNENDVAMTVAGLWRYDDWRRGHGLHCCSN